MSKPSTIITSDGQIIETRTPSVWTTWRDQWTPQERKAIKADLEAAFVQAFIRTCFACGGPVKPDGRGNWICEKCGLYQ